MAVRVARTDVHEAVGVPAATPEGADASTARDRRRSDLLTDIARSYYEQDLTQAQVAELFGISRSQVSRYLRAAREEGIVQIRIVPAHGRDSASESLLRHRFPHLREVVVVPLFASEPAFVRRAVARAAAGLFDRLVRPGQTICVGAGRTMALATSLMSVRRWSGLTVVPATGDAGHAALDSDYTAVARRVAEALGASAFRINAPAMVGPHASGAQLERSNPQIRAALRLARGADLYLLGIGSLAGDEIFVRTGLISATELDAVRAAGGVGDLCGNFYDAAGNDLPGPFQGRVVGIGLDDLRRAPLTVGCAGGEEKVAAIAGALRGRLINGLVTDEHTARGVLDVVGGGADVAATASPGEGGVS